MKILINSVLILFFTSGTGFTQSLSDYVIIAAENNPGLQARYKDFEAALEKVPQVSSLADPTLSFGYFIAPVETRVGPQRARLSLTQMFPWFGTLKARGNAAALSAEAKYQSFMEAQNKLSYQVAAAYFPIYERKRMQEIEQQNIRLLESYKAIAQTKLKNGSGSLVDVLRVDILLKDAKTDLNILKAKESPLLTQFNHLLNRNSDSKVSLPDSILIQPLASDFRRDSLLGKNPVLEELNLKIAASEATKKAAQKQGLPSIGIGVDYVIVGERTDANAPPDNGKNALMPMVSISLPIFRNKYNAAIKEAELMQESYTFQKQNYSNSLLSDYEMMRFEMEQQHQLITLYDQQSQESRQMLNLLFTSYGNSGSEFEEVLRMQQQLLKYERLKASAEVRYQVALAKLHYLTAKSY